MTYVQKTRRQNILVIVGLIIALIVVTSLNLRAQTTVIETTAVTLRVFDDDTEKWTEFEPWRTVDCIIKINVTLSSVTIDNKANDGFKLKDVVETTKGVDQSDGDEWKETLFNALDREGTVCRVGIKSYTSGIYHISVMYGDVIYVYQGTKMQID